MQRPSQVAIKAMLRLTLIISALAGAVVLVGATLVWLFERDAPQASIRSWPDAVWWALTTVTTTGYGDHVPVTTAGRVVGGVVMLLAVATLGAVAAVVALYFARAVAAEEERVFEAEAESLERRLERRLDAIEGQLRRIERRLPRDEQSQRSG